MTWRERAACLDTPHPEHFYDPTRPTGLFTCHTCAVTTECLGYARGQVARGVPVVGVWGGEVFTNYQNRYGKDRT